MRVAIIANPASGRGRARELLAPLSCAIQRAGFAVTVFQTSRAGEGREAVAALGTEIDAFVGIGGDGTINEICSGNLTHRRPIAFLPLGTANLLARELALPWHIPGVAHTLALGRTRTIDLLRVTQGTQERWSVALASAGLDAEIVAQLSAARRGRIHVLSYAWPICAQLLRYRPRPLAVTLDGVRLAGAPTYCLVTHIRYYSGPFVVAPHASPTSGELTVCLIDARSRTRAMAIAGRVFTNALRPGVDVTFHTGRRVEVAIDGAPGEAQPIQIDGDPAGVTPFACEVVPGAMPFFVADRRAADG